MRPTAPTVEEVHTRPCNRVWKLFPFCFFSCCQVFFFFFGRGDAVRFRSIASNASVASWGGTEIDLGRREADAGLAIAGGIGHLGEGFPGGLVIIGILAFPGVLVGPGWEHTECVL